MTGPRSSLSFAEELQALADELLELDGTGEEARAAGPRLANRIERRMAEFLETRPDGVDHALARPAWVAAELLRETVDDWPTEGAATEQKLWEMRALLLAALVPTLDEVGLGLPRMGRWSSWHEAPRGDDDDSNTFSSRAGILSIAGFVDEPDEERARERREQLLAATRLTVRQLRRHVRDAPAVPPPAPSAEEPSEAAVGTARDDRLDQVDREDLTPESVETLQAVYELVGAWMRHKGERLFERHYTDRSLLDLRRWLDRLPALPLPTSSADSSSVGEARATGTTGPLARDLARDIGASCVKLRYEATAAGGAPGDGATPDRTQTAAQTPSAPSAMVGETGLEPATRSTQSYASTN